MSGRFTAILLCAALAGCGGKHPGTYQAAASAGGSSDASSLVSAADEAWDGRADEAKLTEALDRYAEVIAADPTNRHALVRLTRGWYFWGDAFATDKEVKVERWGEAIGFGTQCISLNAKIADAVSQGTKEKDAVDMAIASDVPCLYWTATALGKWGKIQSLSKTLKHLPTVKAYISKVDELDPEFYHYGPARYWGAYYAALPSFAGQDFDKSAEYFEATIEGAPYYLASRVLRAEYHSVGTQDVVQFDKDIKFVLAADADAKPDAGVTAENLKEQDKARALLEIRHELFDKKALEAVGSDGESAAD